MTDAQGSGPSGSPIGSVAEEAAKLLSALGLEHGWVDPVGPDAPASRDEEPFDQHSATAASSCTACPVCLGISWLRAAHPHALATLAQGAAMAAAVLADLAASAGEAAQAANPATPEDQESPPDSP
ncbi:MAG: hypothetical protein ACK5MP_08550 [Nostocoides sp.]